MTLAYQSAVIVENNLSEENIPSPFSLAPGRDSDKTYDDTSMVQPSTGFHPIKRHESMEVQSVKSDLSEISHLVVFSPTLAPCTLIDVEQIPRENRELRLRSPDIPDLISGHLGQCTLEPGTRRSRLHWEDDNTSISTASYMNLDHDEDGFDDYPDTPQEIPIDNEAWGTTTTHPCKESLWSVE
jgi:hypothetical protein